MSADDPAATFGLRLRSARRRRCYTQQRLAELSGVPLGTLRDLEQGRRVPGLRVLVALAHALGYTVTELVGR